VTTVDATIRSSYATGAPEAICYVRRAATGPLPTDDPLPAVGPAGNWTPAPQLVLEQLTWQTGAEPARAVIGYQPTGESDAAVEDQLAAFSVDDQVQVVWFDGADRLAEQPDPADPAAGRVIFEGVLGRHNFNLQSAREQVIYGAIGLPHVDRVHPLRQIAGRWMLDDDDLVLIESPQLPPVLNLDGRPNCNPTVPISSPDGLSAPTWTHDDDDPNGQRWTVRRALQSIWVRYFAGVAGQPAVFGGPVGRFVGLDADTQAALFGTTTDAPYNGLDAVLPEVSLVGTDALEAMALVCGAGGFSMGVDCVASPAAGNRRYQLRLWGAGQGRARGLDVAPRRTTYNNPEQFYAMNNASTLTGQVDATETINDVTVIAGQQIEARLELKPLWSPDDVSDATINGTLQDPDSDGEYARRHVAGGEEFDQYGHVGRVWGLDCRGGFDGYSTGDYQQDANGTDFLALLGLDGVVGNPIALERQLLGVERRAIAWTRRIRTPQPLTAPKAVARGVAGVLEVSEDGGSTWSPVSLSYQTLGTNYGVVLTDAALGNLAAVNLDTLGSEQVPPVDESWWALIDSGQLRFRLTAGIPADHGAIVHASANSRALSLYGRGQVVYDGGTEAWLSPDVPDWLNATSSWVKVAGAGTTAASGDLSSYQTALLSAAEARRDALQIGPVPVVATTPLVDLDRYRLGDVIRQVRGRQIVLGSAATGDRYPEIVKLRLQMLAHERGGPSLRIETADTRYTQISREAD